jgi:hypothetical protein
MSLNPEPVAAATQRTIDGKGSASAGGTLVFDLERLAALRRSGALT